MKLRSLFWSTLCLLMVSAAFTSCTSDDDDGNDNGSVVKLPNARAFILNSGNKDKSNAGLDFYAPGRNADFIANIYEVQNHGQKLGDMGQSIIEEDGYMYVIMSGSKILVKLNSAGVEVAHLSFSDTDGQPRYMVYDGGKLYVTLWSGKVARIDAGTLKIDAYATVGANPEQIVEENDKLYVANSGYGKGTTVSEIDIRNFTVTKTIDVAINPNDLVESNGDLYLISWPDWNAPTQVYSFQKIAIRDKSYNVSSLGVATKMAHDDDVIYLVNSVTDWTTTPYKTVNTFFSYNTLTNTMNNNSFLTGAPAKLTNEVISMMTVDDDSHDIYIGTTDYKNTGTIYRFDRLGKFIQEFGCGGIGPVGAVFFDVD